MTEPDGVHAWLLRLVRAQAHGYGWADLREGFLERATDVLRQPNALWEFSAKNQEKLVWNIAFGAAEAIRARRVHLGAKVAFVDACPGFFASYYGELAEYSQSCDMFWTSSSPTLDTENRNSKTTSSQRSRSSCWFPIGLFSSARCMGSITCKTCGADQ